MADRPIITDFVISVIIPVYNGEKYLERCIRSIFQQSRTNIELIIIDDGSRDSSKDIIQKLEKTAHDGIAFRFIRQKNAGAASARNTGIQLATGDYVTFIDQDDYVEEGYFESYREAILQGCEDIVIGGYQRVTDQKAIREVRLQDTPWAPFLVTAPWAHFYRRAFLLANNIQFLSTPLCEDVYFNLMAYTRAERIRCIRNTGYCWYYNENSVSNSKQKRISESNSPLPFLNMVIKDLPREGNIEPAMLEYFFIRYVTWFELFTVRGSTKQDVLKMEELLENWLSEHYPAYRSNRYITCMPKGEIRSIHLSVQGMMLLKKLHLRKKILSMLARQA